MAKNKVAAAPMQDDWQAQDDMRTLARAHEVKNDPKRHAAAKKHAMAELEKMRAIGQPMAGKTVEGKEKGPPDAEDRAEAMPMKNGGMVGKKKC